MTVGVRRGGRNVANVYCFGIHVHMLVLEVVSSISATCDDTVLGICVTITVADIAIAACLQKSSGNLSDLNIVHIFGLIGRGGCRNSRPGPVG